MEELPTAVPAPPRGVEQGGEAPHSAPLPLPLTDVAGEKQLQGHEDCAPPAPGTGEQVEGGAVDTSNGGMAPLAYLATTFRGGGRMPPTVADVDAAKQAAMSALAGLDMTTTRANLDASKAAASTAAPIILFST